MNGIKIRVDKSRVVKITDENDVDIKWVKSATVDVRIDEHPRVFLELLPELVDIEMVDTVLFPDMDDDTFKAVALAKGYDLVPRCDDETSDVQIESELHESSSTRLPITRLGQP